MSWTSLLHSLGLSRAKTDKPTKEAIEFMTKEQFTEEEMRYVLFGEPLDSEKHARPK